MYAMQYQITLPTDYDMQIIRDRVIQTGHLMDGYHGLEFKAYLIQEKVKGAPQNSYAPFYVWRDIEGMRQFCWGELGYSSIVRDFGRHPIQDWTVHQLVNGTADYSAARSLTVKTVPLPTDYDMQIIRDRVIQTGHLMDGYHGLEFKAYLIQEKVKGAPQNSYAPFYVWRDIEGMRQFCWGELGYSSIVRDFGRHPIQDWTVHQLVNGTADYSAARSLTVKTVPLPTSTAPSHCIEDITADFLAASTDSTIARVTAVDITTWTVILVELSSHDADQSPTNAIAYEVLHVSATA